MKRLRPATISVCVTIGLFLMGCSIAFAQTISLRNQLLKVTGLSDSLTRGMPVEKPYLQFDKPYYALGDTIWFKAYLFNDYLMLSGKSGILNVDMLSDSGKIVKQYRLPMQGGLTWGNIYLDEKDYRAGTYTLRAYTNWMRNFWGDYVYYKTIDVSSTNENNLLVNTWFSTSLINGNNTVNAKLAFSKMDKVPFAVEPLTLQVTGNNNKRLYRQKMQTGVDGKLDVNFIIPAKAANLAMIAETEQKDKKAVIPVVLNQPENTDLQFLPEGGNLVEGLPAHVAFKAIGGDGRGVAVSGIIVDQSQSKVATFKSLYNGMGSFDLTPNEGGLYSAKVTLPGGLVKEYPLPLVKNSGTVLQVKNEMESDSVEVITAATADIAQKGDSYFLIGRARGIVCYAAVISFKNGSVKRKIAKNLFPTDIVHFTLMTTANQPVNERLVFIGHGDDLNISFTTDKPAYGKRDSVALKMKVTDKDGIPVRGDFSFAVTDDASVEIDSLGSENILTHILLTSDLKGYIETPGYYLSSKTIGSWQALDNLLLTQGWVGYDWKQVFNPPLTAWQPEREFEVKGHVSNAFNKSLKGVDVLLFSKKPGLLMDTVTDNAGNFVFHHFPPIDTPVFVLRAVNKKGKSFNVGVTIDEVTPPDFTKLAGPVTTPWYVNIDSTLLNYTKNNAAIKQQQNFANIGHALKEVKITAKKIVKDSKNLNGPGNADLVLDEKDLEAAGKKTLLQLLQEKIKGFREGVVKHPWFFIQDIRVPIEILPATVVSPTHQWYFVKDKPVKIYIDGVSVTDIYPTSLTQVLSYSDAFLGMTDYLKQVPAEDIKGVELNFSDKYAIAYVPADPKLNVSIDDVAYIEITSRSGHGPAIGNTPGMYLYKPLALSWPKQFYKPKYAVKDTANHNADLRSTIDWEPNIITDKNGEAKISFYIADKPSTYTIIINGTDMAGSLGFRTGKIKVEPSTINAKIK